MSGDILLELSGVSAGYGNLLALHGVDLVVRKGEIVTLIGANGAGKSTLLMTLFGDPRCRAGRILYKGEDIASLAAHEISRRRIALSPEGRRVFPRMTVLENLQLGAPDLNVPALEVALTRVFALFPRLEERLVQRAGTLSGGEQQMLAIGRAIISGPELLLLDEPSLGLAPLVVRQIFGAIRQLNEQHGVTVLLVEQNAHHALSLAHRGYVMVTGAITMTGTGAQLIADPQIKAAYLDGGRSENRRSAVRTA